MPDLSKTKPVPVHVGIIMDGNGRWAQKRKLPRTAGHKAGVDRAREIMLAAIEAGIKYLTLPARQSQIKLLASIVFSALVAVSVLLVACAGLLFV